MYDLLLMLYEFLCETIPFLLALSIYRHVQTEKGRIISVSDSTMLIVLALYVIGVFHFTGVGTIYTAITLGLNFDNMNLIPFSNFAFSFRGYLLNTVMFIPFGFLLPFLFPEKRKWTTVIAAGFWFSLLIELSQLISFRATDVDDLIMNTLGATIGFIAYRIIAKCANVKGKSLPKSVLPFVVFSLFFARFCLYAELIMGHLIYELLH